MPYWSQPLTTVGSFTKTGDGYLIVVGRTTAAGGATASAGAPGAADTLMLGTRLTVGQGETLAACAGVVNDCPNAVAFGVNCTAPQLVEGLLQSVAQVTRKPLLAYPNLGGTWDGIEHVWRGAVEWDWAAAGRRWLAAEARLIGGCCRTTPAHIQQLQRVPG